MIDPERRWETEYEIEQCIREAMQEPHRIQDLSREILDYVLDIFRPDLLREEQQPLTDDEETPEEDDGEEPF